ncbi:uncharacterized protein BDZ99DRAFT_162468 [Mytilinidion resinicola]|uniref:Uncharacterized protein n=1 Tax=Mytilinidion resinicola TaxID=574789 RepID=A0A6A6Y5G9_9PEZI|nr:uncharacterized protein BDZ99DRAFT_162468 [Mytilinidion resinicola]KAF2803768.1 hypothetical protein BDZ99DRAFT_162468 [Mytilinidion resinicola]
MPNHEDSRRDLAPTRQQSHDTALVGAQRAMARQTPSTSDASISFSPTSNAAFKAHDTIKPRNRSASAASQKSVRFAAQVEGQDRGQKKEEEQSTLSALQQTLFLVFILAVLWIIYSHLTLLVYAFLGVGVMYTGLSYYLVKSQKEVTLKALDTPARKEVEG